MAGLDLTLHGILLAVLAFVSGLLSYSTLMGLRSSVAKKLLPAVGA